MRTRSLRVIQAAALLIFILASSGILPAQSQKTVQIVILHTNDLHGNLLPVTDKKVAPPPEKVGGSAYIAGLVKQIRGSNFGKVLLLDAGDIAQGTLVSNYFYGRPVIEVMNRMGYDAMVLGNHEFDWGMKALNEMLKVARFPVLAANVVDRATGKSLGFTKPYCVLDVAGIKVGIIGVANPFTPTITKAANVKGLEFLSPERSVEAYSAELRKQGIRVIGVVSHLGIEGDEKLAASIGGLAFIVGGHSHTVLKDPKKVGDTVIVQAGSTGKYLGRLSLNIDPNSGKVISHTRADELIPVLDGSIKPDPEVAKIVEGYEARIRPIMEKVVAEALEDLPAKVSDGEVDSPLGNLITDSMRENCKSDIAIYNSGGIRASIQKGPVTTGMIFTVLPFDNVLIKMDLTGEQIRKLLEAGTRGKGVLQVSGMTYTYSPASPEGSRIKEVLVNGKPLDAKKIYRICTIDFLATGGDGFTIFKKGKNLLYGDLSRDVFVRYAENLKRLAAPKTSRIKVLKE